MSWYESTWIKALVGALPELAKGFEAFRAKRVELMTISTATHRKTVADNDAELARRRAVQDAPTVRNQVPAAAKSNPYGDT